MKAPISPLARSLFNDKKASRKLFEFISDGKQKLIRITTKDGKITVIPKVIKRVL